MVPVVCALRSTRTKGPRDLGIITDLVARVDLKKKQVKIFFPCLLPVDLTTCGTEVARAGWPGQMILVGNAESQVQFTDTKISKILRKMSQTQYFANLIKKLLYW